MTTPIVSIVTPSYNQGQFLENTILSVLEQNYPNLEYIIMDGGSTDSSLDVIREYSNYLTYWQSQPDGGQVDAINAGFQRAKGEIFTFLNSDDFLLPGAVDHMVKLFLENPSSVGWVGGGHSITKDGYIIHTRFPRNISRESLADWGENWFNQPSCFFTAEAARAVGLLNPEYKLGFDFDFWLRITKLGRLTPTERIISAATIHLDAKTQQSKKEIYLENQVIQLAHGFDLLAKKTQKYIDQTSKQTLTGTLAKYLFVTQNQKKLDPNRYVRFPSKLING